MINYPQAILLGLVQGLTEFIPVSSTAHLRIIPALIGQPDPGAAYSAVIQLGTLFSLLIYFRKDLWHFTLAAIDGIKSGKPLENQDSRMAYYLAVATIPISVLGLLFKGFITGEARSLYVIAASLIVLAVILYTVDLFFSRRILHIDRLDFQHSIWIGLAQSLALIPGSSRSGTTLTMGLLLGYARESAMRISFLLSIPAVALAGIYELFKEWHHLADQGIGGLVVGTLVSFVTGYLAIAGLLKYLKSHSTLVFVAYRILLGVAILFLLRNGLLQPMA